MKPANTSQCTGARPSVGLVDVEELVLLVHERAAAVEAVAPPVVLARELPGDAAAVLGGLVGPHQFVAAVTAHVVKGAHLAVRVAGDEHRRARGGDVLREPAAVARQVVDAADVEPRPAKDRVAFAFVELGRDRIGERHGAGAEVGIVLGPRAGGGARELMAHDSYDHLHRWCHRYGLAGEDPALGHFVGGEHFVVGHGDFAFDHSGPCTWRSGPPRTTTARAGRPSGPTAGSSTGRAGRRSRWCCRA